METLYQDYKDQGLMVITLIVENGDSQTPSQEDLKEWADEYGQTFPVLSDPDWAVTELYSERGTPALPTMTLIEIGRASCRERV